jgi:hypothetical protein
MTVTVKADSSGTSGTLQVGGNNILKFGLDNSGQLAPFRNRLINGRFEVDQRNAGASQTITAAAALAYTLDRWYAYCTGANVTVAQISVTGGKRLRFTGLSSNTGIGLGQRIEANNCQDLAGKTATLSCRLSSSSLTTVTWTAFYANTADAFGTLASPTKTQIATGTFTIGSTETKHSVNIAIPVAATTGIEVVFTGGALVGSQTFTVGEVQLEEGSIATPFEVRPYGLELALCQRYYARLGTIYVQTGALTTPFTTPVVMRAVPTITGGGAGFAASISAGTAQGYCYQTTFGAATLFASIEL